MRIGIARSFHRLSPLEQASQVIEIAGVVTRSIPDHTAEVRVETIVSRGRFADEMEPRRASGPTSNGVPRGQEAGFAFGTIAPTAHIYDAERQRHAARAAIDGEVPRRASKARDSVAQDISDECSPSSRTAP